MAFDSLSFETIYTPETVARAMIVFRDYQFARYGLLLGLCCLINALALALLLSAGAELNATTWFVVFIVFGGPLWLAYMYFVRPHLLAAMLRQVLAPAGRVTVSAASVALPRRGGQHLFLPWSSIKVVRDAEDLVLLVRSPLFAYFIPKVDMPDGAYRALLSKAQSSAA
jgi:hypothetical protein